MTGKQQGMPDPAEMEMFGFDPDNERDIVEFMRIIEEGGNPDAVIPDYSRDEFEFGGRLVAGHLGETVVESEVQINSGD